jgi:hypothetical protein
MLDNAKASEESMQLQLDAIKGPQEYFINQIREKDASTKLLKQEATDLKAQLGFCRSTIQQLYDAKGAAESELKRLVASRTDVAAMTDVVRQALALRHAASVQPSDETQKQSNIPDLAALLAAFAAAGQAHPTLQGASGSGASGPLRNTDLQVAPVPRSSNTTPLGSASTRTTPPHDSKRLEEGQKNSPPREEGPAMVAHQKVNADSTASRRYDFHSLGGGEAIRFSAEMPLSEGITYVAPRAAEMQPTAQLVPSIAPSTKWHRRTYL